MKVEKDRKKSEKEIFARVVEGFLIHKILQLTPEKIARDSKLSKEFLVQYGQQINRTICPFEEWSILDRLARYGEDGALGVLEVSLVRELQNHIYYRKKF